MYNMYVYAFVQRLFTLDPHPALPFDMGSSLWWMILVASKESPKKIDLP